MIIVSQSLLAFDTDHIKRYVFGTNTLKEIRGASSILDYLNRVETKKLVERVNPTAKTIYAHGGSALFLLTSEQAAQLAEQLGKQVQQLYHEKTGGGASITYAVQPLPSYDKPDIMTAEQLSKDITMQDMLNLLRVRLRLAKDSLMSNAQANESDAHVDGYVVSPSHPLLCTCSSCGMNYAEDMTQDKDDPDEPEGRYCRVCLGKRKEDNRVKLRLATAHTSEETLWGHILHVLREKKYDFQPTTRRPKDFNVFRDFTRGKDYLGLIYADANGMGRAIAGLKTLREVQNTAKRIDEAVFEAMGDTIIQHLPVQNDTFPFDILLIGGDDIVMVTPADKALQVTYTLTEQFHKHTGGKYTLSAGVVLAPVKYPFGQQHELVEEATKAAKKSGSVSKSEGESEQSRINFVVVTGNTSLSYPKIYEEMHKKRELSHHRKEEFYATLRPYSPSQLYRLLEQIKKGHSDKRLGRTKLHQLRQAILRLNNTTSVLEALALLRNWREEERKFIKDMVKELDRRQTTKQQQMGTLFPWYLDGKESNEHHTIYRTPLLDFVELYEFVSF